MCAFESDLPCTGVDVTLIDAALEMSPEERLEHNDRMINAVEDLRAGLAASADAE